MTSQRHFKAYMQEATQLYGRFSHAAHLQVAWAMLRDRPALEALAEFCTGLRAVAQASGNAEKYNETMTVAWFMLVLERLDNTEDWQAFTARHPDLLDAAFLRRYYSIDLLNSAEARQSFRIP